MLRSLRFAVALIAAAMMSVAPAWADATTIGSDAASVFRDYVIPGNPNSGSYQAPKADIRALFVEVQAGVTAAVGQTGITLADYTPDPTGTADSTPAFQAWWTACNAAQTGAYKSAGGHVCQITAGHFRLASSLYWDMAGNIAGGFVVTGSGENASLLDFSSVAGNHLTVGCSTGTTTAVCGLFYGVFQNFGVLANNPSGTGGAMQLGEHCESATTCTDALNGFSFQNLWVKNIANALNSSGLEVNYVLASAFLNVTTSAGCTDAYGACNNSGDSLLLRAAQFNLFHGSFSTGRCGVHLAMGYSYGNTFLDNDYEVAYYDLCIDSPYARNNKWDSGAWVWNTAGAAVSASAGSSNILDNPNFGGNAPIGSAVGLVVRGAPNTFAVATPAIASGTVFTNATARNIIVTAYNLSSGDLLCSGPVVGDCQSNGVAGGSLTASFPVGNEIKLTTSTGGWLWQQLF